MTTLPTHLTFAAPRSSANASPVPAAIAGTGYGSGGVVGCDIDSVRAA